MGIKIGADMKANEEERLYWYWLLCVENITKPEIRKLLEMYGSPREIYAAKKIPGITDLQAFSLDTARMDFAKTARVYEKLPDMDIRMILRDDEDYPAKLVGIPNEPYGFFLRGKLPSEERKSVSIIGARRATTHGRWMADKIAQGLALAGVDVISGLADGIDGAAHMGALEADGYTLAVLGSGINVCFPAAHERLYREIMEKGGIISEYGPGAPGTAYHFPERNRIISALSDIVAVVEARERSGSLITVAHALEQGRDVMAVPGRPDDPCSEGCNRLLREGAGICTCAGDVLEALEVMPVHKKIPKDIIRGGSFSKNAPSMLKSMEQNHEVYTLQEGLVMANLYADPRHVESLSKVTGIPAKDMMALLAEMELKGYVKAVTAGMYQRV